MPLAMYWPGFTKVPSELMFADPEPGPTTRGIVSVLLQVVTLTGSTSCVPLEVHDPRTMEKVESEGVVSLTF
jgi:hypothetical protein